MTYIFLSPFDDPFLNIAIEDYLYEHLRKWEEVYFLWVNRPSIFMGKYQCAEGEVDLDYIRRRGIPILRRKSGGGTVYHDQGNLNFSVIRTGKKGEFFDLRSFPQPIVRALQTYGIDLSVSERGDLRYEGLKIAGSAQACRRNRILYHLSILFDVNLEALTASLTPQEEMRGLSRVASCPAKVKNLKELFGSAIEMEEFRQILIRQLQKEHPEAKIVSLSDFDDLEGAVDGLRKEFSSPSWIYDAAFGRKGK